jgi:hypothetical protein
VRFIDERKWKAAAQGQPAKPAKPAKRRKSASETAAVADVSSHLVIKSKDDNKQSDLVLMYNTVRGYISAIKELWSYQTS